MSILLVIMVHILAWNVRGAMSSILCLSSLLDYTKCDIAVLIHTGATYLDSIHSSYFSVALKRILNQMPI
jgi:hypothetical protein